MPLKRRVVYRHILVPTDGSRRSEAAAEMAIQLGKALGSRLTALHVMAERPRSGLEAWAHQDARFGERLEKSLEQRAVLFLETIRDTAMRAGVTCECHVVRGGLPHEEILKAAKQYDCDLIVMASHRLASEPEVLLDGETIKVLTHGPVTVLVHH
jgi:nucleotide-binding universal stress UspA family protein